MALPAQAAAVNCAPRRAGVSPAAAIAHALKLLSANPGAAERQGLEVLKVLPDDARAVFVIGAARRHQRDFAGARLFLEPLAAAKHESAEAHFELGLTLAALGEQEGALRALRRAVELEADFADAWLALSEQLYRAGDGSGAEAALDAHFRIAAPDPDLAAGVAALRRGDLTESEEKLRLYLRANPQDLGAARLFAEALSRQHRFAEAEFILAHIVRLAPRFAAARFAYATVLHELNRPGEAIAEFKTLLREDPDNPRYLLPLAACHVLASDHASAEPLLRRLVAEHPDDPRVWMGFGQNARIMGDRAAAIAAFRRALALRPSLGEAYWSLADLKSGALGEDDIAAMRATLTRADVTPDAEVALYYALGKACEDAGAWEDSFRHYAAGAARRRAQAPYDWQENAAAIERIKRQFTHEFFKQRQGWGHDDAAPVFIVGLPRAGSTLVEQILSSHSAVEATMELPHIMAFSNRLHRRSGEHLAYPHCLEGLSREGLAELGREYVAACAPYRKRFAPRFLDKMPTNFFHIGFIKLILPNARIVDVRRSPMSAGFSLFKQSFFRGQNYSYDLHDIGSYYRDYLDVMGHYERTLPGFIHRLPYDDLVENPEREIRRLLGFLELPFEDACLNHWRNARPIATHSSEQVRRPIYRDALDQWRNYAPWLGPLRESLGDALDCWKQTFSTFHTNFD